MAPKRTSSGCSSLILVLTLAAALLVNEAAEEHERQDEVPMSLFERMRGSLHSELPGFATVQRSHPKTIEISSFAFRVGNSEEETGSRSRRSRWSRRDRKLHSALNGQELPLVILQSSRDSDALRKKLFGSGIISDLFNSPHALENVQLSKTELMPRKAHKRSDANPFFLIMHRRLHRNNSEKTASAPVQTGNQAGHRLKSDNETEDRARSAEFAINVIKRVLMNKMLKSSHSGERTKPCRNISSAVLGVPVLDLQTVKEGDTAKDPASDAASFEVSYEVKVLKFDDGRRWNENLVAYAFTTRQTMDTSLAFVALIVLLIALPIAIFYYLRGTGSHQRVPPRNPCSAYITLGPTAGAKTRDVNAMGSLLDEPITITWNSCSAAPKTRSKASRPPTRALV